MEKSKGLDTKKMLKENGNKRTKIRFSQRTKIEILEDTKFFKKGDTLEVHKVVAEQYVKDKLAKKL